MKLSKHLTLFLTFMFFAYLGFSQRLVVQYDFLNDDFNYYKVAKNGERTLIDRPVVTRNYNVKIEVINYNPFVYSAIAAFSTKDVPDAPNLNFLSLMSPLGMTTGGSSFLSQITGSDDPASRGSTGVLAEPDARAAYLEIEKTYKALYQAEQMLNNIDFVLNKVHKLKYNPYLPADSIKAFTQELLNGLFNEPSVETKDFLVLGNTINTTVKSDLASFKSNITAFTNAYDKYASTARSANFDGQRLDVVVQNWGNQAANFIDGFDSDLLLEKLDVLEVEYQSIMNTPYSFNTSDVAQGDAITVVIDFYKNPENSTGINADIESLPKVKSKEIDITVRGDIKVGSSLGVSFPYYSENQNFINKDSIITSIDGNNFAPNISAFLNFYPYNGKNVQFGGTFGVGVPISADTKDFSFLMGFSTIFGTSNRVVLNFGPTLGQVKKLDQGYVAGDNLGDVLTAVPTRNAYQWGAFVGFSFTLVNVK